MSRKSLYLEPSFSKSNHFIDLKSKLFLLGSCFSENISAKLSQRKIQVKSNPYGILFDTQSIETCLSDIISQRKYSTDDLFFHNELYGSWSHHGSFSNTNPNLVIENINNTLVESREWMVATDFVIITLGSAFSYFHIKENKYVANCHKVPQTEFKKELISIDKIWESLENIRKMILSINPDIHIILTISPVRHLRDGVIENNRSKARLIEAVNQFISHHSNIYYFPSYEIVIDVLRDYRFFDIDFTHPNYLATDIVFEYFRDMCISESIHKDLDAFFQLYLASNHRPMHQKTIAHKNFLLANLAKAKEYQKLFDYLNFDEEIAYFEHPLEIWSQ